ncbi:DNA methyltransferase [Methylobacter svalbardensis]|uniref:DNA methyltransferase n=1 Tax=Methylobacter svalbardensis TaxID=3080016 RepID=UPI0030EFA0FA
MFGVVDALEAIKQQRRHFAVTKHVHFTNVWDFKSVQWYPGKHPCEKPLDLMRHIIEASSRPGDMVLDNLCRQRLDGHCLPGIGGRVCWVRDGGCGV